MTARVVFWHNGWGQRIALLCKETKRSVHLVLLDEAHGVTLRVVPKELEYTTKAGRMVTEAIRLRPALIGGQDYPPRRARAHYRRMGKSWGITRGAEKALMEAI